MEIINIHLESTEKGPEKITAKYQEYIEKEPRFFLGSIKKVGDQYPESSKNELGSIM